ncbi:MAG: TRAP transporter small permease [Pseudomonadota bacterium]
MRGTLATWSARLEQATRYLTVIGGICLLAIVLVVTLGVVMRYAFAAPLLGVNEIVQLLAVALVMSALPYCTAQNHHVAVDVFEKAIGQWGRFLGDVLARVLPGFVFVILCRRAVLKALDAWEWGDATNMLRLPIWPFYAVLAAGAGLCVLVFALQTLVILGRKLRDV